MKKLLELVAAVAGMGASAHSQSSPLNYDHLIILDAEDLAEVGIKDAYARLLPTLQRYVKHPAAVEEVEDKETPAYSVVSNGVRYEIYGPGTSEVQSWGNATYALFSVVNSQLSTSPYRFYAISGGNDLGGVFLTESQVKAAISTLKRRTDWPYLPSRDHPSYGQHH